MPKSRLDFWRTKLEKNRARDLANMEALSEHGWRILVIWECETFDLDRLRETVRRFFDGDVD